MREERKVPHPISYQLSIHLVKLGLMTHVLAGFGPRDWTPREREKEKEKAKGERDADGVRSADEAALDFSSPKDYPRG